MLSSKPSCFFAFYNGKNFWITQECTQHIHCNSLVWSDRLMFRLLFQYYVFLEERQKVHCLNTLFSKVHHCIIMMALNSSTIYKLGEWRLERRVRPRIKLSQTHRVSLTTLWVARSRWQVSGNANTCHILAKARGRGGRGIKSQCKLFESNNKTQMTWHSKQSCKPCGASAPNPLACVAGVGRGRKEERRAREGREDR